MGEEIPLPMRIVHVAVDATFQRWFGGVERAAWLASERAGGGLDPEVAACQIRLGADREQLVDHEPSSCTSPQPQARSQPSGVCRTDDQ
jgi:hypothetical protein